MGPGSAPRHLRARPPRKDAVAAAHPRRASARQGRRVAVAQTPVVASVTLGRAPTRPPAAVRPRAAAGDGSVGGVRAAVSASAAQRPAWRPAPAGLREAARRRRAARTIPRAAAEPARVGPAGLVTGAKALCPPAAPSAAARVSSVLVAPVVAFAAHRRATLA